MQPMGDAALHTLHQPYSVETFGAFRSIMMGGDFSPKVRLADVMAKHPTTAVGALADALGEITIGAEHGMGLPHRRSRFRIRVTVSTPWWQASTLRSISWGLRPTAVSAPIRIGCHPICQRPHTSIVGD